MSEVENNLLPCAHCGSPAEEELTVTELSIRCVKCGVKLVRDAADELLAFQDWNTRAQQDPDPDLADFEAVCIDGLISINGQGHLPCNHCEKAIERYIAQNVRTVTTTGNEQDPDPDLIKRAREFALKKVGTFVDKEIDEMVVESYTQMLVEFARSVAANDEMREKLRATEEERDKWLKVAQRLFKMRPGNFIEQLARQGLNEEQLQNFLDAFELKSP